MPVYIINKEQDIFDFESDVYLSIRENPHLMQRDLLVQMCLLAYKNSAPLSDLTASFGLY